MSPATPAEAAGHPGRVPHFQNEPLPTLPNATQRRLDMQSTCNYASRMSTMIQIRHVPDSLHRKLKVCAATEGLSLSDYLLRQVKQAAEQPTMAEILERIAR